jgi:hypothetical protein
MLANSPIRNLDMNTSELLGTSNSSSLCRFSFWQYLTPEGLKSQVISEFEFKEGIESGKQPQGMVPGIHSDFHVSMFPTTESPRSQSSLSSTQCISSRNMDTFWGPCDFFMKGVHRLLQQEPRLTRVSYRKE